jgi:hypothetical protein
MEEINVTVGILASIILGLVLDQKMTDYVYLVRSRTCSSIVVFLIPVQNFPDVKQSGVPAFLCIYIYSYICICICIYLYLYVHAYINVYICISNRTVYLLYVDVCSLSICICIC